MGREGKETHHHTGDDEKGADNRTGYQNHLTVDLGVLLDREADVVRASLRNRLEALVLLRGEDAFDPLLDLVLSVSRPVCSWLVDNIPFPAPH